MFDLLNGMLGVGTVSSAFRSSAGQNKNAFNEYYLRLVDMAINRFKWYGLPDSVDERYLELMLCLYGNAVFFKDETKGFMALGTSYQGYLDDYGVPKQRQAIAANGEPFINLDEGNSVLIFNNRLRTPDTPIINIYAQRLWDLQSSVDSNTKLQKFPVIVRCDDKERNTFVNLIKKYSGNELFLWTTKSLNTDNIQVLNLNIPYVADKLTMTKHEIFNEALTALGITNGITDKKERVIGDEITAGYGAVEMQRKSGINARKQACEKINRMFPELNISVEFDSDIPIYPEKPEEETEEVDKNVSVYD